MSTATATPAVTTSTIAPAPEVNLTPAPNVPGVYTALPWEADDHDLELLRTAGISDEDLNNIGVASPAKPAAVPATPAIDAAGTPAPGGVANPPAPATPPAAPPADETPEQKIARLEKENADLKAGKIPTPPEGTPPGETPPAAGDEVQIPALTVPSSAQPLGLISSDQHLDFAVETARQLREWARANPHGGDMPVALANLMEKSQAMVLGRKPVDVTESIALEADAAAKLYEQADRLISEHAPKRREFLRVEAAAMAETRKENPEMFDARKPEGQLYAKVIAFYPELRSIEHWPGLVRDIIIGHGIRKARQAKAAQPAAPATAAPAAPAAPAPRTAVTTTGATVPLAPAASIGSAAAGGVPVSQARLDEAQARADKGAATDEDWKILYANAE